MRSTETENLLEVRNLKMYFPITKGLLRRRVGDIKAVDDVTFAIRRGETLGLVGESGCGKSTVGRCIVRLYRPSSGQIIFDGKDISAVPERKLREVRRQMGMVFQDPYSSLNPRQSAKSIVGDPLKVHRVVQRKGIDDAVAGALRQVGMDPSMMNRVPHQFSGGQRQRLAIARALVARPSLLICDEPISALDVSIQAQILNLLEDVRANLGLTVLFIAHDLSVVQHVSDRVAVMYLGRLMEIADARELYDRPLHPYTQALLSAVPVPDPVVERQRQRIVLQGEVPSAAHPPSGCHFYPRCAMAGRICATERPPMRDVGAGHEVACHMVP